ncbi:MAG: PEP-CTERM sorting domain-containing protein [Pirellulaceae bacterium]
MNRILGLTLSLTFAWGLSSVRSLDAEVVVYTDKAVFSAASFGLTTIDFNGIAPEGGLYDYTGAELELSGVVFTGTERLHVIDPGFYSFSYPGAGFLHFDALNVTSLPAGTTAVGTDYGGLYALDDTTFSVTLSTGDIFTFTTEESVEGGSLDFLGFTSTVPISSFEIRMPDESSLNAIDNFVFGSAVPEPSTIAMWCVFGLIGGILAWRRSGPRG